MNHDLLLSYAVNTVSCLMSEARASKGFDALRAFVVQDMDAFAENFWAFLFRGEAARLRLLEPRACPDGTFSPVELSGRDSCWHAFAALSYVNGSDCVQYALQFNARSVSAEPDLEVESLPDGGFAVRWNGLAESCAGVLNALVSFVIEHGFAVMPEMEV